MPRRSRIRVSSLENLAGELRFAPRRTILRQIARAERLASEIEPDKAYEEGWVAWKITGYRPALAEPALLVGAALLGDLSAFVERISDEARLSPEEVGDAGGGGTLTIADLCARWRVSRKTIERYRRRGLVGLRARVGAGRVCLVFRATHIEAFERAHADLVRAAGAFSRLDDHERARVARLGDRLTRSGGLSRSAAAGLLAPRIGRGRETIRLALQRSVESVGAPSHESGALSTRGRLTIWRAHRWGIAPGVIAGRFGRSRASVHRIINERRGELLRRLPPPVGSDHAPPAEFLDGERASVILGRPAVTGDLLPPGTMAGSALEFAARFRHEPAMPAQRERALASAYRLLRLRAWRGVQGLARSGPSSRALDEIETALRWATRLKIALALGQCGLALRSVEERIGSVESARDATRRIGVAMGAVFEAIEGFDPLRSSVEGDGGSGGGRLAAPTSLALARALALAHAEGSGGTAGGGSGGFGGARRSVSEAADWMAGATPWSAWLEPPRRVREAAAELGAEVFAVMVARYGLGETPPLTMIATGALLGVSEPRQAWMIARTLALARRMRVEGRAPDAEGRRGG